jgi:hypothetical protein
MMSVLSPAKGVPREAKSRLCLRVCSSLLRQPAGRGVLGRHRRRDPIGRSNGEFASGGAGVCAQTIPYKFLLSEAQRVGTGWLAWSWDNSNSDCSVGGASIFNMTTNLTSASGLVAGWASDVVRDDPNSIKNTSVRHCDWK